MKSDNCKYKIKFGENILEFTRSQLCTFILMKGIHTKEDLINLKYDGHHSLSKEETVKRVEDAINEKVTIKASSKKTSTIDDEYSYGSEYLTPCQYLDQYGIMAWNGQPKFNARMFIDRDEFAKYAKQALINTDKLTEDEAEQKINTEFISWDKTKIDARDIHELITLAFLNRNLINDNSFSAFIDKIQQNIPNLWNKIKNDPHSKNMLLSFLNNIMQKINVQLKGIRSEEYIGTSRFNKTFTAKISGSDELIACHIDQLYIDKNGGIHVFNFKTTTMPPKDWSINKDLKYTYEVALIKRILAANGIPVEYIDKDGQIQNNINFYNIPLGISYNEPTVQNDKIVQDSICSNITSMTVYDPITYSVRNDKAYLKKYEQDVKNIIKVDSEPIQDLTIHADLERADLLSRCINPEYDAKSKGLQLSAKTWIREHEHDIKFENDEWIITFEDGTEIRSSNPKTPSNNPDLISKISERLDIIAGGEPIVIDNLITEIINNYHVRSSFQNRRGFRFSASYADASLALYLDENSDGEHDWQLLQNDKLFSCGILLFKNKNTGQIDIVVPSALRPRELIPLKEKRKNILGYYTEDMNAPTLMQATYGNMEIIRALAVLNEIMPELGEDGKLGDIKVITPYSGGDGLYRHAKDMVKEFNTIVRYLKNNISDLADYKVNFNKTQFVDSTTLIVQYTQSLLGGSELSTNRKNELINSLGLNGLENLKSKEAIIVKLQEIVENIESGKDPNAIIEDRKSLNKDKRIIANIYIECIKTINRYNGIESPQVKEIDSFSRNMLPQYANPDENVRYMANLYARALDESSIQFDKKYSPIRKRIQEFYEESGYGTVKSAVLGSAESVFKNMFELDANGKKTWYFVNPYDKVSSALLSEKQRDFLKFILFQLGKLKEERIAEYQFPFSSYEDPKIANWLKDENNKRSYLRVPLERGSTAHQVRNGATGVKNHFKEEYSKMRKFGFGEYLKSKYQERQSENSFSDNAERNDPLFKLTVHNALAASVDSPEIRKQMLNTHEDDYFETNIEYIIAHFIEKQIMTKELTKVAFQGKCLIMEMQLLGSTEGQKAKGILQKSIMEIEKYLKINVFGKTIMEDLSIQAMEFLTPAKRLMSHLFIAGNLRSAFRDSFEGLWQNFMRTATHFQNDLKAEYIRKGYKHVLQDMFKSDRDINIMSELCLRYRLSNTDAARISERALMGRGGIFNPDQWAYSTLRAPDFLNRMTLFVARCLQDGVWGAFSLDKETHQLKYNWKEDERFKIYASGDENNPKYLEQKALYYAAVRTYNQEHPNNTITYDGNTTPLPEPYSQNEIRQFKMFSDGIYGAYDKSQKAMYENIFLGQTFGVFTTWLNGQAAAWFRKPGYYSEYFTTRDKDGNLLIKRDDFSGNELYMDKDGFIVEKTADGKFIDENGNELDQNAKYTPVIDKIPLPVQGIIFTLGTLVEKVFGEDGIQGARRYLQLNKYEMANFKKALTDLLMWALFGILFGSIFTPAYEEHKKNMDVDNLLGNMCIEALYKSTINSYDGFKGPFAMIQYITDDIEPSAANVSIKVVSDAMKVIMGEKNFTAYMYNNMPGIRVFKDTLGKIEKANQSLSNK